MSNEDVLLINDKEVSVDHCKDHEKLFSMVTAIHGALVGTLKEKGLITKVKSNSTSIEDVKKILDKRQATKNGLLDWTFRIAIGILLSFIALKIGLK